MHLVLEKIVSEKKERLRKKFQIKRDGNRNKTEKMLKAGVIKKERNMKRNLI